MTERPKRLTSEMRLRAAAKLAARLAADGLISENQIEDSAADIAKYGELHKDGYQLARDLENYRHWDCDRQLADALDDFNCVARQELDEAEKAWFESEKPTPPLPIGARISIGCFRGPECGEITGVYEHGPAKYLVKIDGDPKAEGPHKARRIVNWEDALPLNQREPAITSGESPQADAGLVQETESTPTA